MGGGERVCFVCFVEDSRPLFRICRCHTCVHEDCLRKLVNVPSHASHCPICQSEYDMQVDYGLRLFVDRDFTGFFCACACAVLLVSGLLLYVRARHPLGAEVVEAVLYSVLTSIALFALVTVCLYARRHGCFLKVRLAPVNKTISLPPPVNAPLALQCEEGLSGASL